MKKTQNKINIILFAIITLIAVGFTLLYFSPAVIKDDFKENNQILAITESNGKRELINTKHINIPRIDESLYEYTSIMPSSDIAAESESSLLMAERVTNAGTIVRITMEHSAGWCKILIEKSAATLDIYNLDK